LENVFIAQPDTMKPWRLLFAVAALEAAAAGVATAQTVIVTKAPPGSTVEFVLNSTTVGSKTTDAAGTATIAAPQTAQAKDGDMDAHLFVDVCDTLRRVVVVDRTQVVPPEGSGCQRTQIPGVFLVRHVSTLVVTVDGGNPTVLLRQGRFTPRPEGERHNWNTAPSGLIVSGGGNLSWFRDPVTFACGTVTDCSGDASVVGYNVGATYWLSPFIGAEFNYIRSSEVKAEGSQSTFRFNSFFNPHILTAAGKVGIPAGPARIYGKIGASYHRASFGTTQTNDPVTTTTDGVTTTVAGGTQTFVVKTAGWAWTFGGGTEFWLRRSFGIHFEGGYAGLSGEGLDNVDALTEDRVIYFSVGAQVRIGKKR
jgi:hypothetical protein